MLKILVTGADGQLGRSFRKYLDPSQYDVFYVEKQKLDITNYPSVIDIVSQVSPHFIINCAAATHVDLLESEIQLAYSTNALGAGYLAMAAEKTNSKLVHISTDYVFNGEPNKKNGKTLPYHEFDKANPQTVYGASKLEGERLIKEFSRHYYIIRTAWLYGEKKSFITKMQECAKNNSEVFVVNDQIGSPTSSKALVKMIIKLIQTDQFGLYHASCEGECTWYDFATELFSKLCINTPLYPCTTAEYNAKAKRPHYSVLENMMLNMTGIYHFRDWKEELSDYIHSEVIN